MFCCNSLLLLAPVHELEWQKEEDEGLNYCLAAAANDNNNHNREL